MSNDESAFTSIVFRLGIICGSLLLVGVVIIINSYYYGYNAGVVDCKTSNIKCQATYDKYIADKKYEEAINNK
jgi:hypothetical protein